MFMKGIKIMKSFRYVLFSVIAFIICTLSVSADSYIVTVPNWGGYTNPSSAVQKYGTSNSGYMVRYNEALLAQYGDFTAGGTTTRISDDLYYINNSSNLSYSAHTRVYFASGQAFTRQVSSRLKSSAIEPNSISTVVSWGPTWY